MNNDPSQAARGSSGSPDAIAPETGAPVHREQLMGNSIFGPALAVPNAPAVLPAAQPAPALKLVVKGLKPIERQLLEGLLKVSQRRTPRLHLLDDAQAREADVVMIDARDPEAMSWAGQRAWLARRAVIWVDGSEPVAGHTVVRRPVQWPVLPMLLARALESRAAKSADALACAAAPPKKAQSRPTPASHVPQILVVDDSLAVRAYLRSLLEERGYAVTDADSVEVALRSLGQRTFDCVLMDVMMPGIDGYEGCHLIKARGAEAVRVVMLTSKASPFDRIRGKMAGCDAYLTKPVDPEHLSEVLAQQVGATLRGRSEADAARSGEPTRPTALPPLFSVTRPM